MNTSLLKMTATISRMTRSGHQTTRQDVATGMKCLVIPSDAQTASASNLELSRSFDVFFDGGSNVKVSDKIVVDGIGYYIKGVREFKNVGSAAHMQCIAEIEDVKK